MALSPSSPLLGSRENHIDFSYSCEAAKKQKFLPDDTDTIGQLFYLVVLNPSSGQSALKSRHVELIRQHKLLNSPHTCLERNSCQIMAAGGVATALLGCLSLRLLASHYNLAALATGVATVFTGIVTYIGARASPKDTDFIQQQAREELIESYKKIASKLQDLHTQNPSLAKRIASMLSPDAIQNALNAATKDGDYSKAVCSPLRDTKQFILSNTSPLPSNVACKPIDMHDIL